MFIFEFRRNKDYRTIICVRSFGIGKLLSWQVILDRGLMIARNVLKRESSSLSSLAFSTRALTSTHQLWTRLRPFDVHRSSTVYECPINIECTPEISNPPPGEVDVSQDRLQIEIYLESFVDG